MEVSPERLILKAVKGIEEAPDRVLDGLKGLA
jgi:hypothetical protein